MALNIVHAVEFSRNGHPRFGTFEAPRPRLVSCFHPVIPKDESVCFKLAGQLSVRGLESFRLRAMSWGSNPLALSLLWGNE